MLLNVNQVAERLNISVACVRKWIVQKRIPTVKLGSLVRIKEEDVERIKTEGLR